MKCCMNWSQCLNTTSQCPWQSSKIGIQRWFSRTIWEWIQAKFRIPQRSCHPCACPYLRVSKFQKCVKLVEFKSQRLHPQVMEPVTMISINPTLKNPLKKKKKHQSFNPISPHVSPSITKPSPFFVLSASLVAIVAPQDQPQTPPTELHKAPTRSMVLFGSHGSRPFNWWKQAW